MDTAYLQKFCSELNIPLYLEEIEVDLTVDPKKPPCFICSWQRRKRIFELSKELDCNKIAFGHHKDDAIQTLLLNMIYHGSFSYATLRTFKKQEKSCPYQGSTKRDEIKDLIQQMDKLSPDARRNIFNAMNNIYQEYLPGK